MSNLHSIDFTTTAAFQKAMVSLNGKKTRSMDNIPSHSEQFTDAAQEQSDSVTLKQKRSGIYSIASLKNKVIAPLKEVVPDLIYEGLNILAAPPKAGKSWLVLGVAAAVASGGVALSRFHVKEGDVLYLALEDSERRLQDRMNTLLGEDASWPARLDVAHSAPLASNGLEQFLEDWLKEHPEARFIVIDTWGRVKPPRKRGADPFQDDYAIASKLQALALKYHIAILVVHHTKKAEEEDFLAAVSGSFGVTGPADAVTVLKRKRGEQTGILHVTGRDIDERDLALKQVDGDWICMGDALEVQRSETRRKIIDSLKMQRMTPKEIAKSANLKDNVVRRQLAKMLPNGEIHKDEHGFYFLP